MKNLWVVAIAGLALTAPVSMAESSDSDGSSKWTAHHFDDDAEDGTRNGGDGVKAPEIDPSSAASGLTLLLGGLAIVCGRRGTKLGRAAG